LSWRPSGPGAQPAGRFLWVADTATNLCVAVDTRHDTVANEIGLAGTVSPDPAPDLMAISPDRNRVYVSLRFDSAQRGRSGREQPWAARLGLGSCASREAAGPGGAKRSLRSATWWAGFETADPSRPGGA
jgi:DNA-binding beta-propeller fold protein YncE